VHISSKWIYGKLHKYHDESTANKTRHMKKSETFDSNKLPIDVHLSKV